MSPQHKFVYFGTPTVASETLATLVAHGFTPTLVVTSPDAPKGRGLLLTPSSVKTLALSHNIEVLTPEKLDDETVAKIKYYKCDYGICVAYGKVFPQALIDSFPLGVLNIHYSLLPKHRGASPLEATLLAGDSEAGVTVQKMIMALDAGDIVAQEATPLGEFETARELRPRLITLGAELLVRTLPLYLKGKIALTKQDESQATHMGKYSKEEGELLTSDTDETKWRKYRAYADGIGMYFFEDDKRVKVTQATFKNNTFVIERVIPEGKPEMDYTSLR